MWIIDLPTSLEGYSCTLCAADGIIKVARHRDILGTPVCTRHFVCQVRLASILAAHAHEESGADARKRNLRRGRAGGLAAARRKRAAKQGQAHA